MRSLERIRVRCIACGWSGGRAALTPTATPCSKCGGPVETMGDPYIEERVLAGCRGCGWWGERPPSRVEHPCPRCTGLAERLWLTRADGSPFAVAS